MKKKQILAVVVCVMLVANIASATIVQGIDIDFVTIGNVGNPADSTGYGAVGYEYSIGKYEVTNAQWNAFVSLSGGAPTGNPSSAYDDTATYTGDQQPTNGVSWYEILQFCNYLTSGDKSKGVYQFSGNNANAGNLLGTDRAAAQITYGTIYFLPTENEWYKAAYFKPDNTGYSLYAYGMDTAPAAGVESNYTYVNSAPWNIGSGTVEQNGTYDMMGNVSEWNDTRIMDTSRVVSGGWFGGNENTLVSSIRWSTGPYNGWYDIGFRVAYIQEPETKLVEVDIKPGSCPNPLNVKSKGVLPVAILSTENFDVHSIDTASIRLVGVAPIRSSFEDVTTPMPADTDDDTDADIDADADMDLDMDIDMDYDIDMDLDADIDLDLDMDIDTDLDDDLENDCNCNEEAPDGFIDLTLKFKIQEIAEAIGEVNHGDELTLHIEGVLIDQTPITGSDCVVIVGKHKPINVADINKDGVVNNIDFAIFSKNWLKSSIVED